MTDEFHPTWVCVDALTMREHAENRMHIIKVVFVASLTWGILRGKQPEF
ncbi:ornithine carbamoyltransferase [Cutibacterium acnes]|nr:hypothetical protein [Cutibacterium acnes]OFR53220.1 ornithine carbamoyltransferase [Propionibacterium sp. HMSC078F10]ALT36121.1 ornithine carbamoyltransferase [Cutibacterium acnes]EFT79736.1 hypothetical protein HMPREF9601_02561 [Cutibacterium acnes HL030PA1]MBU5169558.1 ornithine carbamoyltransferase [Cutibacterium acnes]MBU5181057.1 ornithine carbamoyltransferase [Cutibacterium acnes]